MNLNKLKVFLISLLALNLLSHLTNSANADTSIPTSSQKASRSASSSSSSSTSSMSGSGSLSPTPKGSGSTSINFEDELIEGTNQNPFDSLTQVQTNNGGDHSQLNYSKSRAAFELEIRNLGEEMGYRQ